MSLATLQTGQPVATRWRFVSILGLLVLSMLALAPQAQAGFIGYYDISNINSLNFGNWVLVNSPTGIPEVQDPNGTATTPDSGMTLVVTGSQTGSGFPSMTDFEIVAPSAGTVSFLFTYSSLDTMFPLCGGDLMSQCDDGGYVVNGVYTQLATDLSQVSTPTMVSFSVNAGDTFGFQVDAADNTGEPGNLSITNFSAPAPLSVPEPSSAGMLALAAATVFGLRRKFQQTKP